MSTQKVQNLPTGCLIEPKRVPEGFLLVDPGDAFSLFQFIFGCLWLSIWCGGSFSVFIALLFEFLASPSIGVLLLLLFISIFVAIGVAGIVWGIRWLTLVIRLKPGEVVLSSYPLRMGESHRVRFRRRLRLGITPRPGKITAKWLCYEWIQYQRGTDTETETSILWETDLLDLSVSSGTRLIEYDAQITVLPQGPPSLDAKNNQIRWELRVNIDFPGVAKDTSYFRFKVIPEVL